MPIEWPTGCFFQALGIHQWQQYWGSATRGNTGKAPVLKDTVFFFWKLPLLPSCSASQSCLTLCDPMNCSTPGFPALHRLLKFAQTHAHWVSDAPLGAMTFSESSRLLETAGYLFLGGGESVVEGRVLEREQLCSPSFGVYVHFSILILLCY